MQIISGSKSKVLAEQISSKHGYELCNTNITNFADGELRIKLLGHANCKDVVIVQSTSLPVNDSLMELLLLADAALRSGAQNITAIVPYLCYARQDNMIIEKSKQHHKNSYEPLSANLVARMIEASGINKLITLDIHSDKVKEYFNIPVINLTPYLLFKDIINDFQKKDDLVIISPDEGGKKRASEFSVKCNTEFVYIKKYRDENNQCVMHDMIGSSVNGKNCVLIDDIVDTGGTIIKAAQILSSRGAKSIMACITHPVLSNETKYHLQNSVIDKIYISDSIIHPNTLPDKFYIVSVYKLIASAL